MKLTPEQIKIIRFFFIIIVVNVTIGLILFLLFLCSLSPKCFVPTISHYLHNVNDSLVTLFIFMFYIIEIVLVIVTIRYCMLMEQRYFNVLELSKTQLILKNAVCSLKKLFIAFLLLATIPALTCLLLFLFFCGVYGCGGGGANVPGFMCVYSFLTLGLILIMPVLWYFLKVFYHAMKIMRLLLTKSNQV